MERKPEQPAEEDVAGFWLMVWMIFDEDFKTDSHSWQGLTKKWF
jgi:hypothetical protein